jgi:hypothetical protein
VKKLPVLLFGFLAILLSSCQTRITDFTIVSSKNIELSKFDSYERGKDRVTGEDHMYIILVVPTAGNITIKEAMDRAIESVPGCVALVDGVIYQEGLYVGLGGYSKYIVEGTPLIDPNLNGPIVSKYHTTLLDKNGNVVKSKSITKDEFEKQKAANSDSTPVDDTETNKGYAIYVGPYAGVSVSENTSVVDGRQLDGVGFNAPTLGASIMVPFSKNTKFGGQLDFGISSLSYATKPADQFQPNQVTITEQYNYFNIQPSIYLNGFVIGLNFGIPTSADFKNDDSESELTTVFNTDELDFNESPTYDKFLKTTMEVKVGGRIPLLKNDFGKLSCDVMAGYVFSGLYQDDDGYIFAFEGDEAKSSLNPNPVSFSLGLCYQFKVGIK